MPNIEIQGNHYQVEISLSIVKILGEIGRLMVGDKDKQQSFEELKEESAKIEEMIDFVMSVCCTPIPDPKLKSVRTAIMNDLTKQSRGLFSRKAEIAKKSSNSRKRS